MEEMVCFRGRCLTLSVKKIELDTASILVLRRARGGGRCDLGVRLL